MKHNPRLNEKMARLPGFADVHPLQPQETVQGALQVINELAFWLIDLTGMHGVAMSPKAGAHGELCGLLCIRAALEARGDKRAGRAGARKRARHQPGDRGLRRLSRREYPGERGGRVDLEALKARLGPDVAAVMITNPNTCGLFEPDMKAISDAVHAAGAFVYCDGANFNAIVGKVRPGDLGIDAMHINLHKTFSTPHGGGGPGSGPVVLRKRSRPSGRCRLSPNIRTAASRWSRRKMPARSIPRAFGRMVAFHGQMGMFTRALTYILSHGADGLKQVAEDAVLNANYILRSLEDVLDAPFANSGPCMHEAIFSDRGFAGGLSTIDLAKALIDEGFHPMTMYFPLVVHGAMLVEPTETESKASLDQFIMALRSIADAREGRRPEPEGRSDLCAAPAARRDACGAQAGADLSRSGRRPRSAATVTRPIAAALLRARRAAAVHDSGVERPWRRRSAPAALRNREPIAEFLRLASGERARARNRERHRRACRLFRGSLSSARMATERHSSGCPRFDRGVA